MANLGQTAQGATAENGWALNTMWGRIGTAIENGSVNSLSCYINDQLGNIKLSLYEENVTGDGPGAKIYGQETGQALSGVAGFFTDASATGTILAGKVYWIGVKLDSNAPSTYYDLDGAYLGLYDGDTYGTAWPSPGTFTTTTTRRWSVYVTYTPSAGGDLSVSLQEAQVGGSTF